MVKQVQKSIKMVILLAHNFCFIVVLTPVVVFQVTLWGAENLSSLHAVFAILYLAQTAWNESPYTGTVLQYSVVKVGQAWLVSKNFIPTLHITCVRIQQLPVGLVPDWFHLSDTYQFLNLRPFWNLQKYVWYSVSSLNILNISRNPHRFLKYFYKYPP